MEDHLTRIVSGYLPEGSIPPGGPVELLERLADDDLEHLTVELQRHIRAAHALMVRAVAEVDRRRIADDTYALTTRQWLRRFLRQTSSAAGSTLTQARTMHAMPNVAKRALAGDVPRQSLRLLATAQRRHPDEFPLHEEVFADIATDLDAADLRRALDHWRQQVDHREVTADIHARRSRRRASVSHTVDGMWHLDGWLDPDTGHRLSTAVRSLADPGNLDPDDHRTYPQRVADALGQISTFWLDHHDAVTTSGGTKPHLAVTVSLDQLAGAVDARLPELDGTPVAVETIRRIACDAGVVRIIIDGEGQPLDVGRRVRTVTPAIRRALDLRDGGCAWKGCDAPAGWCDAHHRVHWADGGPTALDNMELLCPRHHTAVHEGGSAARGRRAPPRPDD